MPNLLFKKPANVPNTIVKQNMWGKEFYHPRQRLNTFDIIWRCAPTRPLWNNMWNNGQIKTLPINPEGNPAENTEIEGLGRFDLYGVRDLKTHTQRILPVCKLKLSHHLFHVERKTVCTVAPFARTSSMRWLSPCVSRSAATVLSKA